MNPSSITTSEYTEILLRHKDTLAEYFMDGRMYMEEAIYRSSDVLSINCRMPCETCVFRKSCIVGGNSEEAVHQHLLKYLPEELI